VSWRPGQRRGGAWRRAVVGRAPCTPGPSASVTRPPTAQHSPSAPPARSSSPARPREPVSATECGAVKSPASGWAGVRPPAPPRWRRAGTPGHYLPTERPGRPISGPLQRGVALRDLPAVRAPRSADRRSDPGLLTASLVSPVRAGHCPWSGSRCLPAATDRASLRSVPGQRTALAPLSGGPGTWRHLAPSAPSWSDPDGIPDTTSTTGTPTGTRPGVPLDDPGLRHGPWPAPQHERQRPVCAARRWSGSGFLSVSVPVVSWAGAPARRFPCVRPVVPVRVPGCGVVRRGWSLAFS